MAPKVTWDETGKVCSVCGIKKPLDDFYVYERSRGGLNVFARCKPCHLDYGRSYREANPDVGRNARMLRKYGIGVEEYEALLVAQGGVCAICGVQPKEEPYGCLQVDHDHETGEVRGLLCRSCNTALNIIDDPIKRERALAYLGLGANA